jgi:hypothetical protein
MLKQSPVAKSDARFLGCQQASMENREESILWELFANRLLRVPVDVHETLTASEENILLRLLKELGGNEGDVAVCGELKCECHQ